MTKDEALKRALEALYNMVEDGDATDKRQALEAITATKEALAQPEQKPVAWEQFHKHLVERDFCPRCGKRLASGFVEISIHKCTPPKKKIPVKEVYKREWVGLTATEIHDTDGYTETREIYRFACALEAKLKEKNT